MSSDEADRLFEMTATDTHASLLPWLSSAPLVPLRKAIVTAPSALKWSILSVAMRGLLEST